jgi:hypothetical protein
VRRLSADRPGARGRANADLKIEDLEVPDDGASDRQPAYREGADGARPDGRCPDGGSAKASRWELYRCTLLPAAATP